MCNVGFGLITASIAKTPGSSTGIAFLFILPQMFLGTFVPAPSDLQQFVPSYYVTHGLTSILLKGAAVTGETIIIDLLMSILFAVVIVMIGIVLYSKIGKD